MKYYVWHNTRNKADEYLIVNRETDKVILGIPRLIGRTLKFLKNLVITDN